MSFPSKTLEYGNRDLISPSYQQISVNSNAEIPVGDMLYVGVPNKVNIDVNIDTFMNIQSQNLQALASNFEERFRLNFGGGKAKVIWMRMSYDYARLANQYASAMTLMGFQFEMVILNAGVGLTGLEVLLILGGLAIAAALAYVSLTTYHIISKLSPEQLKDTVDKFLDKATNMVGLVIVGIVMLILLIGGVSLSQKGLTFKGKMK